MGNRPDYTRNFSHTNITDTGSMYSILQHTALKHLSLVEVAGYTANAFRIIIDRERVNVAGYSAFEWPLHHKEQFENLGVSTRYEGGPTSMPPSPEELERALELIQWSLDRGIPVMAWDLFVPDFGVIYGYNDETRTLRCRHVTKDGELPYEMLGRGQAPELYVIAVTETMAVDKRTMLRGALKLAVRHAREQGYKREDSNYRNGLAGYDAWIEAFGHRNVEVFGNSLHGVMHYDQRLFAAEFMKRVSAELQGESGADKQLGSLAGQAAVHYDKVADNFAEFVKRFPFPKGGDPNDAEEAAAAIRLLTETRFEEEQGVVLLEQMLLLLDELAE
ncbi:hypothetical protein [Paenibacillus ginsengarvi]|uniref:Uncharacterized protein n=1 Tax=Paenibacillus ginsengarvi TaxID=400777 RepID=A0A3B0CEV0_9BACL|nr:hypothetical protein [Paenibacillus ginsengarvi]RKN84535.1 hypothetical protein D7M11_13740 [Paenibacillus ginsengarvi]